ncbi:hypothetical protein AVEN_201347-1 [Araneus ventricosus]|uniref:Uncharacterized protein n=1 Tax=Araneus ventricosus TaxID=182803 RepID=A0A4Y2M708_ARAVE|nr:hypothetical protein AVEN_201347-1 [Araneus ventricosus]
MDNHDLLMSLYRTVCKVEKMDPPCYTTLDVNSTKLNKLRLPQFPRAGSAVERWGSLSEIELLNPYSNAKEEKATETNTSLFDGGEIASAYLHSPRVIVNKLLPLNYNKAMVIYMLINVL